MNSSARAAIALLLLLAVPSLQAGDAAYRWLERMSAAIGQMTYQGTFVYVQGTDFQTMRITHVVEDGEVRERLVCLSGPPGEIVRDSTGVRWFSGDERGALVDPAIKRPIFFELPLNDAAQASDSYEFRLLGTERIAGHSAQRLDIEPRDRFRYGYSLWLDEKSGLLLQWKLRERDGDTLARLLFTDLKIGSEVDHEELRPTGEFQNRSTKRSSLPVEGHGSPRAPHWTPATLPPGFRLASHRAPGDNENSGGFQHLVYSDGIAAVSVYIEALNKKPQREKGVSRMGTTHAYFRPLNGKFVTVVGDVPEATVKLIGEAVAPVKP